MSRPLRIEYPDAWYHVMNRGRRSERIFKRKDDYKLFIEILKEASEAWNLRICAYCLMPNHYHLLVQTPLANLSRGMRHINGIYTQRFNRQYKIDGQLFKGRYKSILIDADNYLLACVRYIHKNPEKAKLSLMDQYEWSSHQLYLSDNKAAGWIYKDPVFQLLTRDQKDRINRYRRLMLKDDDTRLAGMLEGKKWPGVFGKSKFVNQIKAKYYRVDKGQEVPRIKELAPEPDALISMVCKYYKIDSEQLYQSRRGQFNEPRNVVLFLMRQIRKDSLKTIGEQLNINKYSSVSSAIERLKIRMGKDPHLKKRVKELLKT